MPTRANWYSKEKLRQPEVQKILHRPRLLNLLYAGGEKKLILVCAPSGYGKTTLVSSYCRKSKRKTYWYRLDKTDADPIIFINYLVEALEKDIKGFGTPVRLRLQEVENIAQELEPVLLVLVNELFSKVNEDINLVFDGFDEIADSAAIKQVLNYFLGKLPSNIHLIVLSRAFPDLALARLGVNHEVTIIDTEDLKFNKEDIQNLFTSLYPLSLDSEELDNLAKKTEGWIASLLLVYDSLKDLEKDQRKTFILNFMGTKNIYQYLAEEVFEKEDEQIKEFLKNTSILSYINEDLGVLLTDRKDSRKILEYLDKNHVFTTCLNGSFKYHPLFKQFLVSKASEKGKDYLHELNKKAALYFQKNSHQNQAIYHFFEAEMYEEAKDIIVEISDEMINTSKLSALAFYIDKLPASLQASPRILLAKSEILEIQGRVDEALSLYGDAFNAFKKDDNREGMGISLAKQGELYRLESEHDKAIILLEESLLYLPEQKHAFILCNLAICYLRTNIQESIDLLQQALHLSQKVNDLATKATILHNLALPHLIQGEFQDALSLMRKSLTIREELGNRHEMAHTLSFISLIHRMRGDYEKSLEVSEEALRIVEEYDYRRVRGWVLWTQAETYLEIEEIEKARSLVREALSIFDDLHDIWGLSFALRILAKVYEFEEQYDKAIDLYRQAYKVAESSGGGWEAALSLSDLGRLYIKREDTKQAESCLQEAKQKAINLDSRYTLTSIYVRLAYLYFRTRDYQEAKDSLNKAIAISKKYDYHHLLAQEAREALPLLTWAFTKGISMDYLGRILFRMASEKLYRQEEATILFADIRGFTNISEDMAPKRIRQVLNTYLAFLTEIVFQHKGTLDKYIGDAIMAFFSTREGEENHALRAIKAALKMQEEIKLFQSKAKDMPNVTYGIGINTGVVVLGHIGSGRRLDFTILGDPVNVASRLCSKAKQDEILIGESTYEQIKDAFQVRNIGPVKIKGKRQAINVYEVKKIGS